MDKLPHSLVTDGRLSPAEELANRRKIRLIQVRQQEQQIAKRVRSQVKVQKRNVLQDVAQKLNKEFENRKNVNYAISKEKYVEGLSEFGKAHENAASDVADQALVAAIFDQQKREAHKRYTEAVQRARMVKAIEEENENALLERRLLVKKKEAIRAKQIAMLPKKEVTKDDETSGCNTETTIMTNGTQTALVERSYAQEITAKDAALDEESRCAELDKDRICDHSAQIERARVRHLAALRKARMTHEYTKLESDVKMLQRKAAFTKRNNFSGFPGKTAQFQDATQAELLDTLGIPQSWDLDLSDAGEHESTDPLTQFVTETSEEAETSEADAQEEEESATATSVTQSDTETSDFSSGMATSETEDSYEKVANRLRTQVPDYGDKLKLDRDAPAKLPSMPKDIGETRHVKPKKKKAVAFELPEEKEDGKMSSEDSNTTTGAEDDLELGEKDEETTKPLKTDFSPPESYSDVPVKDTEQKDEPSLPEKEEKSAPTPPLAPTSSVKPQQFTHSVVSKALQQPDVLAFQRRILETHAMSVSEPSIDSSVQDTSDKSTDSINITSSESEIKTSDTDNSSFTSGTATTGSVVSLEDGLEKIASGIQKREEELKRQQDILEEYKRKLIAQQKQHAAIAKLSATVGKQLNKVTPPVSPEMQALIDQSDSIDHSQDGGSINVIHMSEQSSGDSLTSFPGPTSTGATLKIPSLLMMTDPNQKPFDVSMASSSASESVKSNVAVAEDNSDTMEVHEISTNSVRTPSILSKSSSGKQFDYKTLKTPTSSNSHDDLSFVELTPFVEPQKVDSSSSSGQPISDFSFDKHSFMELQPDISMYMKPQTSMTDYNPNVSSFIELTPQTPGVELKDVTSTENTSDLNISEHPLSVQDRSEISYPPFSSIDGGTSIEVRTTSDDKTDASAAFDETSWKALLAQSDTTADSTASTVDSSVETLRTDETVIEMPERGILEEPDMTLLSLNSTILSNNPLTNDDFMLEKFQMEMPTLNNSAIIKEKVSVQNSSLIDKSVDSINETVIPAKPVNSDACLARLFQYLMEIEAKK
uniref:Selenoprotein N, 1 n=1 Tax=Phallusia mammillata TaxID=59560 RepID=A0A6F9DRA5_9ASCI|nr:selenoprotein N, 1 [Phallusia mammillata]